MATAQNTKDAPKSTTDIPPRPPTASEYVTIYNNVKKAIEVIEKRGMGFSDLTAALPHLRKSLDVLRQKIATNL